MAIIRLHELLTCVLFLVTVSVAAEGTTTLIGESSRKIHRSEFEGDDPSSVSSREIHVPVHQDSHKRLLLDPASEVVRFHATTGPDYCLCSWVRPHTLNGQLLGYDIEYRESNSSNVSTVQIRNDKAEIYEIDYLKPETDYVVTIYPVTEHGRGLKTSKNVTTKKAHCPKGTGSYTGFTPCRDCFIGEYNDHVGQMHCKSCPNGMLTASTGSKSITDCYDPASQVVRFAATPGPDYCTFSWVRPHTLNGQLLGYDIEYRESNSSNVSTVQIRDNRAELYEIDNLKPETSYVVTIYPVTELGRGMKTSKTVTTKKAN